MQSPDRKLARAYRALAVVLAVAVAEAAALALMRFGGREEAAIALSPSMRGSKINIARALYPQADFAPMYPGRSPAEIDAIQLECYGLAYMFEPFVQFKMRPHKGRYVEVTQAGYRGSGRAQPWPPDPGTVSIFVFGGSTTFGYSVADEDTLPASLQRELQARWPQTRFEVYNFGRGYFYLTQERALFERLLSQGHIPKLALFIDGLNEFAYPLDYPEFSSDFHQLMTPDLPPPWADPAVPLPTVEQTVVSIIRRFQGNVRLAMGAGRAYGVPTIFIGQPTPFLDFSPAPQSYPFRVRIPAHRYSPEGYPSFRACARNGDFGPDFVWCGDAFTGTSGYYYVDAVHYSRAASDLLAKTIVDRCEARGLLPWAAGATKPAATPGP